MEIRKIIKEEIEQFMKEDYPSSFSMDEFKKLTSFAKRIVYCQEHLQRISSGSSRIVYKIDDEKVLKLAKNKKGLAQNSTEIEQGQYSDLDDILAKVFDSEANNLWVEMELARKLTKSKFKQITGFEFKKFVDAVHNYGIDTGTTSGIKMSSVSKDEVAKMWEDEFVYSVFNYMGNYGIPANDLTVMST